MANPTLSGLIDRLRSLTIGVVNLQESLEFYTRLWGLTVVHQTGDTAWLRASGTHHHVLVLKQSAAPSLLALTFGVRDRVALEVLYQHLLAAGVATQGPPRDLQSPGEGSGFSIHDPEGRLLKFVADRKDHASELPGQDTPFKLAHVVLNSVDSGEAARFFVEQLGFRLSDQTGKLHFLRCNADHHSIAFAKGDNATINHVAFEMPSWNALMFGLGRLRRAGHAVQWGLGRHGPGDNVFSYFLDPNGFAVEYTAEMQQVNEATHQVKYPGDWKRPVNLDAWGYADMPTEAVSSAMHGDGQAVASDHNTDTRTVA
jgi:catechol 2,3-dioxygenase